ncbi:hypothetical protein HJG60_010266 [Phyllostomus discolor]|uniref:Uncharacterized protein n=1 Tax=Phyllostomus discolor TaxID=89673 RepID=A0A834ASR1_9CHIR|nr:hypothetical protein HJG60_010266 [Phyllostomus discolor]
MAHAHLPHSLPRTHRLEAGHTCTHIEPHTPSREPVCTPLCSPGSSHLSLLPSSLNPSPMPPSPSSLLTPRFDLSASPGLSRLLLSAYLVLLKGRRRERGRKNRKEEGNRRMKPRKGQWCPELSHCITMSMDSIKLRSAC